VGQQENHSCKYRSFGTQNNKNTVCWCSWDSARDKFIARDLIILAKKRENKWTKDSSQEIRKQQTKENEDSGIYKSKSIK
jgi:hypothetical protein